MVLGQHCVLGEGRSIKELHSKKWEVGKEDLICYADLIKEGIESGLFDIVAHPDLYMDRCMCFGETEAQVADIILTAAEKYRIPIEINLCQLAKLIHGDGAGDACNYPHPDFWKMAAAYDVKVLYGLDVHRGYQLDLYSQTVEKANGIIGDEVISKLHFVEDLDFEGA